MSAATEHTPCAPPGRRHLRAVPGADPDAAPLPGQEEEQAMAVPAEPDQPDDVDPAVVALAARIQAVFVQRGQTLDDDTTATSLRASLDAVQMILDGAQATALITDEQHTTLSNMIGAAACAPDIV